MLQWHFLKLTWRNSPKKSIFFWPWVIKVSLSQLSQELSNEADVFKKEFETLESELAVTKNVNEMLAMLK